MDAFNYQLHQLFTVKNKQFKRHYLLLKGQQTSAYSKENNYSNEKNTFENNFC